SAQGAGWRGPAEIASVCDIQNAVYHRSEGVASGLRSKNIGAGPAKRGHRVDLKYERIALSINPDVYSRVVPAMTRAKCSKRYFTQLFGKVFTNLHRADLLRLVSRLVKLVGPGDQPRVALSEISFDKWQELHVIVAQYSDTHLSAIDVLLNQRILLIVGND